MRIDRSRFAPATLQAVADAREGGYRHEQHADDERRHKRREDWLARQWRLEFGEGERRAS